MRPESHFFLEMVYTLPLSPSIPPPNLPPIGINYYGEALYGSTLSNWRLNERMLHDKMRYEQSRMNNANRRQQPPSRGWTPDNNRHDSRTHCGQCQSLASRSSQLQEDLETNKVLLAEKEDQIADLLAGMVGNS